ncbi:MAG TPA: CHASE3 domain-containing protein [Mucilaginibacter sp.]|nr:CHASE3 domain-containing protein [Mucilaginibacter sp.]
MKTRLVRNLQIWFGLSLLFLVCVAIASYSSIQNMLESSKEVDHSKLVARQLTYAMSTMKDAETGQRGYLLTGYEEFLQPYNGSYQKAIAAINEFQNLTKDNAEQQINAAKIKEILLHRLNILQELIDKRKAGKAITKADLVAGKDAMDAMRAAVSKAEADEEKLLHARVVTLNKFTSVTPLFVVFATLVAIAISIISYFRVLKEITERAKLYGTLELKEQETAQLNEELTAANEELNTANEDLAAFNEELNASNEELASANEELNSSNEQLLNAQENIQELNEKLGASNEELSVTVDELYESQQNLQLLNDELEDRVDHRTRELAESESRFRVMMATLPQIAWTSLPDGEVTFFNRKWYDYTGRTPEQSLGWAWTSIIHPDDLPRCAEAYKSILESGEVGEFEARKINSEGVYRWHLARIQPVINDEGEARLWVGTATDIDELKNLQQQKDDFISIASHELKTPITSLKVSLQLLDRIKGDPSAPTFSKLIVQANKSLDKVGALIEDLLNVSRLNQGQLYLNKRKFSVGELVGDCCEHVRVEGEYSLEITGDKELEVYADPERIEQVIINFVNNAIKYAPQSREIDVRIEKQGDLAKVSVTDHGPGIHPEKVAHLFERYFRVDTGGLQFSGLGLGLYISSEIIKRHDGKIGVDTELGKGSTFWFTIPIGD